MDVDVHQTKNRNDTTIGTSLKREGPLNRWSFSHPCGREKLLDSKHRLQTFQHRLNLSDSRQQRPLSHLQYPVVV